MRGGIAVGRNEEATYEIITDAEVFDLLELIEERFHAFVAYSGYPDDLEYFVSRSDLIDIIIRVDKREAYFHYFHNKMEINERKKVALYAYWILKFKPFRIVDQRYLNRGSENSVNEAFAIYMICSILFYAKKLTLTSKTKETFYRKLMYAFRFRNISIDAMLLLVESLNVDTFDKEYQDIV